MAKLKKNSKVSGTAILDKSEFFQEKELTRIDVPMMNVALSGHWLSLALSSLKGLAGLHLPKGDGPLWGRWRPGQGPSQSPFHPNPKWLKTIVIIVWNLQFPTILALSLLPGCACAFVCCSRARPLCVWCNVCVAVWRKCVRVCNAYLHMCYIVCNTCGKLV